MATSAASSFLASDLYGRGARIGFYLQGVSAAMTLIPVPSAPTSESLNYASQILPIGIMAFAFICSQDALLARHQISFPEALAVFGAVHAALLPSICGMHAKPGRHSTLSLGMTVLSLFLAQMALVTSMARDASGVSIKGGIALLVISIVYMAGPLAYWIYRLFRVATGRPRLPYIWHLLHWKDTIPDASAPPQYNNMNSKENNMYDWFRFFFIFLTLVGLGVPIAMTEATIEDHGLEPQQDVFSPGQLASLVLGLVLVVWQFLSMVEQIKESHRASNSVRIGGNAYQRDNWSVAPSSQRKLTLGSVRGMGEVERGVGRGDDGDNRTIRTTRTASTARSARSARLAGSIHSAGSEDLDHSTPPVPVVNRNFTISDYQ